MATEVEPSLAERHEAVRKALVAALDRENDVDRAVAAELIRIGKVYAESAERAVDAGDSVLGAHQLGVSIYLSGRASELRGEG